MLNRLPFSIANILSLILVFYTVYKFFNNKASIYTLLLFSLNGLLLAFGRILQYQSFIILFAFLNFYFLSKYLKVNKSKYLIYLGINSGIALLFHYDSLTYIVPTIIVILIKYLKMKISTLDISKYFLPFVFIAAIFFIPYIHHSTFLNSINYLFYNRISSYFEYDTIYYSFKILSVYLSKEYIIGVLILTGILLLSDISNLSKKRSIYTLLLLLIIVFRFGYQKYNLILIILSFIIGGIIFLHYLKDLVTEQSSISYLKIWFLFSFLTYGLFFSKPLTHIYTILLSGLLLLCIQLDKYLKEKNIIFSIIVYAIFSILIISSVSYNFNAFIDTKHEYPWNKKTYIFGDMNNSISSGNNIAGVFGFPYFRNWNEIRDIVHKINVEYYSSNEKYNVTKYYMQGYKRNDELYDLYIYVNKPQTNILNKPSLKYFDVVEKEDSFEIYFKNRYFDSNSF